MPVTYTLQGSLLSLTMVGEYAPQEVPEAFQAGLDDPACPRPVALLADVTQSKSLDHRAPHEIRRVAEFLGRFGERIGWRCAVVAASDVQFGLSQMGAVFSADVGVSVEVFRNHEEALQWLGASATSPPSDRSDS
jgi:hypothetical protein